MKLFCCYRPEKWFDFLNSKWSTVLGRFAEFGITVVITAVMVVWRGKFSFGVEAIP